MAGALVPISYHEHVGIVSVNDSTRLVPPAKLGRVVAMSDWARHMGDIIGELFNRVHEEDGS